MATAKDNNWPLPYAKPEDAGMSAERVAKICPGLQKFIDNELVSNLVTLVARHGKIVHYEAQGYMDLGSKRPATKDTIYRLWSNSKPLTGTAVMICVEEGLLNLDDPISKYIPAFKNQVVRTELGRGSLAGVPTVPIERDITIRDCLRNTTGLAAARRAPLAYLNAYKDALDRSGLLLSPKKASGSLREVVEAIAELPLESQPGTRFEYQVGYPIIGLIIEIVTGKSMEEFYSERIFQPLGMKDASFYMTEERIERFPTLYRPVFKDGKWTLTVDEKPGDNPTFTGTESYLDAGGGGGGVLTTAADYMRFATMLLNGGELEGVRILGRKTVELMTTSHTGDIPIPLTGPGFGFGMGLAVYLGGADVPIMRSVGTFGWSGAAGTICFIDPKEDLIGICFSQVFMHNVMGDNTYQEEFERLVYQALI
jgi:CubicO group peptidase (beta-lactamase class C family)